MFTLYKPPTKGHSNSRVIGTLGFIAVAGFGVMYAATAFLPLNSAWSSGIIMLLLIVVGIGAPYLLLKLGAHEAHLRNPQEEELHLEDIPKDQDQLQQEKRKQ